MGKSKKIISVLLSVFMAFTSLAVFALPAMAATGIRAEGWHESLYAEWYDADPESASVSYKLSGETAYTAADSELIREKESGIARVDIPGLTPGSYDVVITASDGTEISYSGITVDEYDRSGYAHFNYTSGVGAYNDDGTLKSKAVVLYVTDENKDTVELPFPNDPTHIVKGIGNILNSRGASGSSDGLANTNDGIILAYSQAGIPLDIRFIGTVTAPEGLTAYDSTDYGGSEGDNGYMARMRDGLNITIEGIGTDAKIYGWGIHFIASSAYQSYGKSFEVRNLTFESYPEDALGMEGVQSGSSLSAAVERCWIHNCSFLPGYCASPAESDKKEGDGSCDFKRGGYYTMSYCYYYGCHKTNLIGASDTNIEYNISFHHNWWQDCDSRQPLLRYSNMHIYNNYYQGSSSKTMDTRYNSYVLSEANYFDSCKNPVTTKTNSAVKSYNDIFYNCTGTNAATVVTARDTEVSNNNTYPSFDTDPSLFYYNSLTKTSNCYLTDALTAKAECIAYSGVLKDEQSEASVTPVITAVPENAISYNYSIAFTAEDAGARMTAAGVENLRGTNVVFEDVLYNATSDYKPSTTYGYLKSKGLGAVIFKLDKSATVTIECADAASYGLSLIDNYGLQYANAAVGGTASAVVPAGIYAIQCENTEKEAYIASFSLTAPGEEVETTTEATTVGTVDIGTYNIGTDCEGENDCTDTAGTFGNIAYDLNSIAANYGTVNNNGDSGISFSVAETMNLTVVSSDASAVIEAYSGKVNDTSSVTLEAGTNTVKLYAGTYVITGAESTNARIYSLTFAEYEEITTETTTETTTYSTPVDVGEPTEDGDSCYVQDNGNGTYTLIDNSSSVACRWYIPFTAQTSGQIVINGEVTLNKVSGSWPFIQVGKTDSSGSFTHAFGFGSNSSKVLGLYSEDKSYVSLGEGLTKNQTYSYEFIVDMDKKTVTLTVDGDLTASSTFTASSIDTIMMQTANSDTERTVTATIPYVGILGEAEYILGDVTGDGQILSDDATRVLLYYAKQIELTDAQLKAADVTGDGQVLSDDATRILLYYAKRITEF
ncbi:MAG: dockerin type I domain-containing protein [Clostridiales bacterium]|nr:dockerin type I domain-containing protein [Clostridiales bacterium]